MGVNLAVIEKINSAGGHDPLHGWCLSRYLLSHFPKYRTIPYIEKFSCNGTCPPGEILSKLDNKMLNDLWFVQSWMYCVFRFNLGLNGDKNSVDDAKVLWRDAFYGEAFSQICGTDWAKKHGRDFNFTNRNLNFLKLYDIVEREAHKKQNIARTFAECRGLRLEPKFGEISAYDIIHPDSYFSKAA